MVERNRESVPRISEAEWEVMDVIWDAASATADDVVQQLASKHAWSAQTVKTMINRLVKKAALEFTVEGKHYLYRPRVSRATCVRHAGRSFLSRVFSGRTAPMLAHFLKTAKLSPDEIEELKQMLNRKGG